MNVETLIINIPVVIKISSTASTWSLQRPWLLRPLIGAGINATYGTYVDDECFDIHNCDDDTDHDTDDDADYDADVDTNDDTDDDADDGGRGNRRPFRGGAAPMAELIS